MIYPSPILPTLLPSIPYPSQPAKKKARRLARKAKAAAIAPRPTQLLRPVVHPPTQRYNHKTRLGKGFSMQVRREGRNGRRGRGGWMEEAMRGLACERA